MEVDGCRVCGVLHLLWEVGHKSFTALTPNQCRTAGQVSGYGKSQEIVLRVEECSLRPWQLELARAYQGLQGGWGYLVLRLLVIQAMLGAAEELRMEWGPTGWIYPKAEGEKRGELQLDPVWRGSLAWLGGGYSWEC